MIEFGPIQITTIKVVKNKLISIMFYNILYSYYAFSALPMTTL